MCDLPTVNVTIDPGYPAATTQKVIQQIAPHASIRFDCVNIDNITSTLQLSMPTLIQNQPLHHMKFVWHFGKAIAYDGTIWQSFVQTIANNTLQIHELSISYLDIPLFVQVCMALVCNHTVHHLHLYDNVDKTAWSKPTQDVVLSLQQLLKTRRAPLGLTIDRTSLWWQAGLAIDTTTQQPSLPDWYCVHQSVLSVLDWPHEWALANNVIMHALIIDLKFCNNRQESLTRLMQTCQHGQIHHVTIRSAWSYLVDSKQYSSALASCHSVQDEKAPTRLCNLRILSTILEDTVWQQLLEDTTLLPHLQAATVDRWDRTLLRRLFHARPNIHALRFLNSTQRHNTLALNGTDMWMLADSAVQHLDIHYNRSNDLWWQPLLSHPQCPVQSLCLRDCSDVFHFSMCAPHLYAVLLRSFEFAIVDGTYAKLVLESHRLVATCPKLCMLDALPEPFQKTLFTDPSPLALTSAEYHAARHTLVLRQAQFVLQRDAWQQSCFLFLWWGALRHHPLGHSCMAWLSTLRSLLDGAAVPAVQTYFPFNDLFCNHHLDRLWMYSNRETANQVFRNHPCPIQSVIDSQYICDIRE